MLNNNKKFIVILTALSIIIVSSSEAVNLNESCMSPRNETGICTHLENCQGLLELITNAIVTDADRDFLRKSQCGLDTNEENIARKIMVCCTSVVHIPKFSSEPMKEEDILPNGNILPEVNECGPDFNDRIYGGNTTRIDEFPWLALIQYKKSNLYFGFHCGGTLINSRYVLTAAHCIKSPDLPTTWEVYAVRLGEWNLETPIDCEFGIRGDEDCAPPHRDILIEKVIVHENYKPGSPEQYFDITLLRLSQTTAPYNDFIRPICLPIDDELRTTLYFDDYMTVSGWGSTETAISSIKKLKAVIPGWNTSSCDDKYQTYSIHINRNHQICAGGQQGIDTCRGDSGGPLMLNKMVNKRTIYYAVGIVSFGPRPCGLQGWPGVYTRVGYFIDWIKEKIEL